MATMEVAAGVLVVGVASLYLYLWMKKGVCRSGAVLTGKTVVITGANTGLGYETALDLARRDGRVVLACRDIAKANEAALRIRTETGNANVSAKRLDLCSFKSIRSFVTEFLAEEDRLDILINNAGITALPLTRTEDGLECIFATNHFGPFLLTNLLLDRLKSCAPSRVVNLTSICHKWGAKIEFDNLLAEKSFDISTVYFNSKLAVVLFTRELARRLVATGVTANSLHPGTVNTHLLRYLVLPLRIIFAVVGFFFFKNARDGAQTTIHCAVSETLDGVTGRYFSECWLADEATNGRDDAVAKKLWEVSERVTRLGEER